MSGAAAVAAAVAARRRLLAEEEEMTTYGSDDLNQDWEFKIVRANRPVFRRTTHLNRVLEREAQAGWIMVEKFDNSRLRFKRRRQARLNDSTLPPGVDPYRVHYGLPPVAFALLMAMTMLTTVGGIIALVIFWVNSGL